MIARQGVECPGCQTRIALRLSVGADPVQPFYYVCPSCKAATHGAVHADGETGRLEVRLSGGRTVDEDTSGPTLSINPEFPGRPEATEMTDPGGSSFLSNMVCMGERKDEFRERSANFSAFCAAHTWAAIQRLFTYYTTKDWNRFDTEFGRLGISGAAGNPEIGRHQQMQQVILGGFSQLCEEDILDDLRSGWDALCRQANTRDADVLLQFAHNCSTSGLISDRQGGIFRCLTQYVEKWSALRPGFPVLFYHPDRRFLTSQLRIFRDDFTALKTLYQDAFEVCHKNLDVLISVANIAQRGSPDGFALPPAHLQPQKKKPPGTIQQFRKLVSAEKSKFLVEIPAWEAHWPILDRRLRNTIGHYSAHHDLPSGVVVRDDGDHVEYLEFVVSTIKVIGLLLALVYVLTSIEVNSLDVQVQT